MKQSLQICLIVYVVISTTLCDLKAQAQPFDASYSVEINQGNVLAPSRVIGLGGAAIGVADGAGAITFNPAAVANRLHYNGSNWFAWDWAATWLTTSAIDEQQTDLENNGSAVSSTAQTGQALTAITGSSGKFSFGLVGSRQSYTICQNLFVYPCPASDTLVYETDRGGIAVGYNFFEGQLVFGGLLRSPWARFKIQSEPNKTLRLKGSGAALGVLWRPRHQPFRVGLSTRRAVKLTPEAQNLTEELLGSRILPEVVIIPWQIGLGMAWSWGPRPMNPTHPYGSNNPNAWNPPKDRQARRYILLAGDLVVVGATPNAVGIESWISQEVQRAGEKTTVSVRLGLESEFWPGRMQGRIGTYFEPSRFAGVDGRLHQTAGVDLHLGKLIWAWRLAAAFDVAKNYTNAGLSLGFWH